MMMTVNASTTNSLVKEIEICQQQQFTGRLEAIATDNQQWSLYFCLGRLIWATGGVHLIKRWQRLLAQYCPQISSQKYVPTNNWDLGEYQLLIGLVKKQEVKGEEAVRVIRNAVTEVLFDLLQQEQLGQLTFTRSRHNLPNASLTLLNPQHAVIYSSQAWEKWCKAGLKNISPNAAVLLSQREQLQQHTSAPVYKTLVKIVDGERTLRDLAVLMKQDLLLVTRLLNPYIRQGIMELILIGDLLLPATGNGLETAPKAPAKTPTTKGAKNSPLIAFIDDSRIMGKLMENILTGAGYRFVGIDNAVEALPVLLESQPSLIFLDLMMPIANGYEVCSQIRRISQFKNIPVIILTGNDGIIDRVRAKIVGSSEFLSKPIKPEQVLAVVRKYLPLFSDKKKFDSQR